MAFRVFGLEVLEFMAGRFEVSGSMLKGTYSTLTHLTQGLRLVRSSGPRALNFG